MKNKFTPLTAALLTLIIATIPSVAQAAAPQITVDPQPSFWLEQVTLEGEDYTPNSTVTVTVPGLLAATNTPADTDGDWDVTFTVPLYMPAGNYTVTATDNYTLTAQAVVTVKPLKVALLTGELDPVLQALLVLDEDTAEGLSEVNSNLEDLLDYLDDITGELANIEAGIAAINGTIAEAAIILDLCQALNQSLTTVRTEIAALTSDVANVSATLKLNHDYTVVELANLKAALNTTRNLAEQAVGYASSAETAGYMATGAAAAAALIAVYIAFIKKI